MLSATTLIASIAHGCDRSRRHDGDCTSGVAMMRKNTLRDALKQQRIDDDNIAIRSRKLIRNNQVRPKDIVDGRGGDKSHGSNKEFLDIKDQYFDTYIGTNERNVKQECRDIVIDQLNESGYRFLITIVGEKGVYRLMTKEEIERKVSQALRTPRKAMRMETLPNIELYNARPFINDHEANNHLDAGHRDDVDVEDAASMNEKCNMDESNHLTADDWDLLAITLHEVRDDDFRTSWEQMDGNDKNLKRILHEINGPDFYTNIEYGFL